jgi:hypothetical protein
LLGLYFFQKIAQHVGATKNIAILMTICLGVGTIYWKYTVTDFSEITQTCIILTILHKLLKNENKMWAMISFLYSILILIKLTYFIFFPLLVIYFGFSNFDKPSIKIRNNFIQSCYFILPTCLMLTISNYLKFQNIFESGYGRIISFSVNHFIRDWTDYIHSYDSGVLTFNPILILAFYSLFLQVYKRNKPIIAIAMIAIIWYLVMCLWVSIKGGYCWGNRLLVPIVPLLFIPCAYLNLEKLRERFTFFTLLIISIFIQFSGVFTKVNEVNEIKLRLSELSGIMTDNQLLIGLKLFFLKLFTNNSQYNSCDFGSNSSTLFDLKDFESFNGFNIWILHLIKYFNYKIDLNLLGNIIIISIFILVIKLLHGTAILPTKR